MNNNGVRTKVIECPACLEQMDGASAINSDEPKHPKPGDFSVCIYCGAILRYDEVGVRSCAEEEMDELEPDAKRVLLIGRDVIKSERWQKIIKEKGLKRDR